MSNERMPLIIPIILAEPSTLTNEQLKLDVADSASELKYCLELIDEEVKCQLAAFAAERQRLVEYYTKILPEAYKARQIN